MTRRTDDVAVEEGQPRHEVKPSGRSSIGIWAIVLTGPVTWITHFMVVYLAAEVVCTSPRERGTRLVGQDGLSAFILVATAVALAIVAADAVVAWRRGLGRDDAGRLRFIGLILAIGSILAILFVGLPVIWLRPC